MPRATLGVDPCHDASVTSAMLEKLKSNKILFLPQPGVARSRI